jgi:aryl-alcohol dehydrogenase-like predicted oxidoreductase
MPWYVKSAEKKMAKTKLKDIQTTVLGLGGQGILEVEDADRDVQLETVQAAIDAGITHFDTSPLYGDSEEIYGEILPPHRDGITIATKTEERGRSGALKDMEKSLKRLKTDHVDIWFIHHIESPKEAEKCARRDGVAVAMAEMKDSGVVKLFGASCHEDPMAILRAMEVLPVDVILIPVNPADPHMKPSFVRDVIPEARRLGVAVIGMKVMSQGHLFSPEGVKDPVMAVRYALARADCSIVACRNSDQAKLNAAAAALGPLSPVDLDVIEEAAKGRLREACFFRGEFGGYHSQEDLGKPYIS